MSYGDMVVGVRCLMFIFEWRLISVMREIKDVGDIIFLF